MLEHTEWPYLGGGGGGGGYPQLPHCLQRLTRNTCHGVLASLAISTFGKETGSMTLEQLHMTACQVLLPRTLMQKALMNWTSTRQPSSTYWNGPETGAGLLWDLECSNEARCSILQCGDSCSKVLMLAQLQAEHFYSSCKMMSHAHHDLHIFRWAFDIRYTFESALTFCCHRICRPR